MFTGYHELTDLPIKQGDRVRVPVGVEIKSKRPGREKWSPAFRYVVTVHHVTNGSTCSDLFDEDVIHHENPTVVWVGSGGYWNWVDINLVEKADERLQKAG